MTSVNGATFVNGSDALKCTVEDSREFQSGRETTFEHSAADPHQTDLVAKRSRSSRASDQEVGGLLSTRMHPKNQFRPMSRRFTTLRFCSFLELLFALRVPEAEPTLNLQHPSREKDAVRTVEVRERRASNAKVISPSGMPMRFGEPTIPLRIPTRGHNTRSRWSSGACGTSGRRSGGWRVAALSRLCTCTLIVGGVET